MGEAIDHEPIDLDLIIRNGRIVTASEVLAPGVEIGVKDGKIACLGRDLERFGFRGRDSPRVIDAEGVSTHMFASVPFHQATIFAHTFGLDIQQDNSPTGDTWETGSRSAIAGGNTTVIAFADQKRSEESIWPALEAYHAKATGNAYCDYGFHVILTNPNEIVLEEELPLLVEKEGVSSIKIYMTYEPMKLGDGEIFNIMMKTRSLGITTMVHAENSDMIEQITKRLCQRGNTHTFFHSVARPQIVESEAAYRAISLAEVTDTPILLVHMSAPAALKHVSEAQRRLLPVHAETCPHYLYLLSDRLKSGTDDLEGAKYICAPPLRHNAQDLEEIWLSLANGTITVISSDHAPATFDHPGGKLKGLTQTEEGHTHADFRTIPNGLPGMETRLPLLFDRTFDPTRPSGGFEDDKIRISLTRFVGLTSTNPAKLYGLGDRKGSLSPGYDADIVIWHPEELPLVAQSEVDGPPSAAYDTASTATRKFTITNDALHHGIDYTPFEGIQVRNWPRWVFLRGKLMWNKDQDGGRLTGSKGDGQFLKRGKSTILTGQMGRQAPGMFRGERDYWA